MPIVKHAVIAAAGLGSRLGMGRPKCLIELDGVSLMHAQLALLQDVPDVRIVVGFEELAVMRAVRQVRPDALFVRNPAYRTTTTLQSYALGARGLSEPCLFMDADIWFEPASFDRFLQRCTSPEPLLAVTTAKTVDAVYVHMAGNQIHGFSRTEPSSYAWANLCWLPAGYCETGTGARLRAHVPGPPSCMPGSRVLRDRHGGGLRGRGRLHRSTAIARRSGSCRPSNAMLDR